MAIALPTEPKLEASAFALQLEPLMQMRPGFTLHLRPIPDLDDDQFFEFCEINQDFQIERTDEGEIIVMTPAGGETSRRNLEISVQLGSLAKRDGTGLAFDSSGGFRISKLGMFAPDAAWVLRERYEALSPKEKRQFPPICPDFVIELRSQTDRLKNLQSKMDKWVKHGARLAWLIDSEAKSIYVYRPGQSVELVQNVSSITADPILPGFTLDLTQIW